MKAFIEVEIRLLATHMWPGATGHRKYLSNLHAHIFIIKAKASVTHADRDIEFHDLRDDLDKVLCNITDYDDNRVRTFNTMSCEQIGSKILKLMPELSSVSVSEDGHFSAEVVRSEKPPPTELESRAYLASSSKGDRALLHNIANKLVERGHMVFSPCLGFIGKETPEVRPAIMQVCLATLSTWAEVLFILDEGIPSEGCEIERKAAKSDNIPVVDINLKSIDDISYIGEK